MKKTRVAILGAGISGLAAAWRLSKRRDVELIVIEKSGHPGGWMQSDESSGYFFEKGPRTFAKSRCAHLLQLIDELHLSDQIITSSPDSSHRYLRIDGRFYSVPSFGLLKKVLWPLLWEWSVPPRFEEETIYEFAARRFNPRAAELLFDPLAKGIFAGDIHQLSMNACFPGIKAMEENYGSLTRGFLKTRKNKKKDPGLFSFKEGTGTLLHALVEQTDAEWLWEHEVKGIRFDEKNAAIVTDQGIIMADEVISTLPPYACARLFEKSDEAIASLFASIPMKSLSLVHLGYPKKLPLPKGFGYLIPTCEEEEILGMVFDSTIFPQQNQHSEETRLTIMLPYCSEQEALGKALRAVRAHLNIQDDPEAAIATSALGAIPQYEVGHQKKIETLEARLKAKFPRFHIHGNYLRGSSVDHCCTPLNFGEWKK